MGNFAFQSLLSSDLASRRFLLRPPEPSAQELMGPPGAGICLGASQQMHVPVCWDYERLANPHVAVLGMTGSGKSYFIKTFITRAYRQWGVQALILDWPGEYGPWVERAGGTVVRLGPETGLNILDCRQAGEKKDGPDGGASGMAGGGPDGGASGMAGGGPDGGASGMAAGAAAGKSAKWPTRRPSSGRRSQSFRGYSSTPLGRIEQVVAAFQILTDLGAHPKQVRLLKQALEQAFVRKRLPLHAPVRPSIPSARMPTLRDALAALKSHPKKSRDDDLAACIDRLEGFCRPGADFLSRSGGLSLDSLIGRGLVSVDFSGLPSEAHRSMAGLTLLQFLKERMRDEGWSPKKGLKLLVVADEAWKIAQDERSDLVAIMREGRKYAFGLVVASQNPSDLSPILLSNAGSVFVFRLLHSEHREALRASMQFPPTMAAGLERFAVGQALVRLAFERPGIYDGPFVISRIEGEEPAPRWKLEVEGMEIELEREEFKKRLWRLGCTELQLREASAAFERADRKLDAQELARLLTTFGYSRSVILSFLRGLGVPDAALVPLFSRLQARSLGVRVNDLVQLVVRDEKTEKRG